MINKERWEQVESIYHAALAHEPDARPAFLDEACAGDVELRTEVDSLLRFDGGAEKFFETPAIELQAKEFAADENSLTEELVFRQFGPYKVVARISHGGMGDVFLGIDTRLDRKVAIKLLFREFTADAERVSRFKQEARTTSTLNHPNIVTLYEIGEVDGHHYLVTEYVEGQTLRQRITSTDAGQIGLRHTLSIVTQVLDALQVAHEAGVIHRDIKPENIVLRRDGLVKVLDFGIAKLTSNDPQSQSDHLTTKTGVIMGTASYMSPEQARGQKVDHRTDIFSVGCVLYEMLSGARPFEGETMADVMAAVLVKEPKRLDALVPNIPPALIRMVDRCLEKQPEKRFQTASDLSFSLKELATSTATAENVAPTATVSLQNPAPSKSGFSPRHLVLIGVLLLVAVFIGVIIFKTKNPTVPAQAGLKRTPSGTNAPATNNLTRLVWFDLRGNQLGTVGAPGDYSGPALSPAEDRIAVALNDRQTNSRDLWIFPLNSDKGVRLTADSFDDLNPVWTPDGKWIIYSSERSGMRNIYRTAADGTGAPEPVLESNRTKNVEDISRDGKQLMFNTGSNQGAEPNLATLSLLDRSSSVFFVAQSRQDAGRFSPDGRWVAYRSQETGGSEIFVRGITANGASSNQQWRVSSGQGGNTQPMWRGDGRVLYYLDNKVLTSVEVTASGSDLTFGNPTPLFKVNIEDSEHRNRFLVTKDGERFLFIVREENKTLVRR